jgi:alanyl-tRNA synthetase
MNNKLTSEQIRKMYIDFFVSKQHENIESAPLVPFNDKSLLWINSGVAALKEYFDGRKTPDNPRIVSIQKCIRTNDIENVGVTARHQTFFEMMGNFSIGDYEKPEAISFAWKFLTNEKNLALDKDKLYVTVFNEDDKAFEYWNKTIGLSEDRIFKMGRDTNFWDMGEGPCGPCSEIFYDRGEKYDPENIGTKLLSEDLENDRYIEVWNIVFSEYNNDGNNNYKLLERKNIDTGMGFERLVSIIQEKDNNFETDIFAPIVQKVEELSNQKYTFEAKTDSEKTVNKNIKIIADHVRAVVIALSDGAQISNEGRGYVLRRLIRRAMNAGLSLGIDGLFITKIVEVVIKKYGVVYSELIDNQQNILDAMHNEEVQFNKTLEKGIARLEKMVAETGTISAENAFMLFDTYGFPFEMTKEIALEKNIQISQEDYDKLKKERVELSRKNSKMEAGMQSQSEWTQKVNSVTEFVGYTTLATEAQLVNIVKNDALVKQADLLDGNVILIFDKTPFYAQSGGQASDNGYIKSLAGETLGKVLDVQKIGAGAYAHTVSIVSDFKIGEKYLLEVDQIRRNKISLNHSATHLLHLALDKYFGTKVTQAGASKDDAKLRFDFATNQKFDANLVDEINKFVKEQIDQDIKVEISEMGIEEAKTMGAHAQFGDKYGSFVRVVKIGESIELCGGTHVETTSQIEDFAVTKIESKGSGVFRIEAITSNSNVNAFNQQQAEIRTMQVKEKRERISNVVSRMNQILKINDIEELITFDENTEDFEQIGKDITKKYDKLLSDKLRNQLNSLEPITLLNVEEKIVKECLNQALKSKSIDLEVVLDRKSENGVLIIAADKDKYDLKEFGIKLKNELNLRGGGNPEIVQFNYPFEIEAQIIDFIKLELEK